APLAALPPLAPDVLVEPAQEVGVLVGRQRAAATLGAAPMLRSLPTNSQVIGPTHGISTISTIQAHLGSPLIFSSSVCTQSASAKTVRAMERTAMMPRAMAEV